MNNRSTKFYNTGNWIGVCTAIGAALGVRKPKGQKHSEVDNKNG